MRFLCALEAVLLMTFLGGNAYASKAPTGTYKEAVAQVIFSDETSADHPLALSDLDNAAPEMHTYWVNMSYGKLNFQVHFARVSLPNTRSHYQTCGSGCDLFGDAVAAALSADSTFLNSVKGVSIMILAKYNGGNFTYFGPRTFGGTQTYVTSLLSEKPKNTVNPPGPSQVSWGGWCHEFGHQLEVYGGSYLAGKWKGHPSGYNSGYDQMDSCYPCGESSFGLLGSPLVEDPRTVFAGWLDSAHVATVPIPSGHVGATFVLPPLTQNITTPTIQAVKIPIDSQRSYMVNVRMRLNEDAIQARSPLGIYSEGVQIQYTDVNGTYPVTVCVPTAAPGCTNTDGVKTDWPFLLWQVGQTFTDPAQNISIAVVASSSAGYTVNIDRDVPPGHPDLFITPWLTPPENAYETVDIWVDSSCNGYEDAGGKLRYGRRADGTVIGSGDDPCLDHENRVYATIHNIGTADAPSTTVKFQVSSPLGVGVTGSWTDLGTASLPSIPVGGSATVYVTWTPTASLTLAEMQAVHFHFHSCIQVMVAPAAGEIVTSNNSAQENIKYFEAVAEGSAVNGKYKLPILNDAFSLTSDLAVGNLQQFSLQIASRLPAGWTYTVNKGRLTFPITPTETLTIPVKITPVASLVGKIYDLKVEALTIRELVDHGSSHPSWYAEGGVDMNAHTVLPDKLTVSATTTPPGSSPSPVQVTGTLTPARKGAIITIDLYGPNSPGNAPFPTQVTVQADGSYSATIDPPFFPTTCDAVWQGDMTYSSAVATANVVVTASSATVIP